jgi:putative transposase
MFRRRQTAFKFKTHGGKRRGAGRKPKGEKAGIPHSRRPRFSATQPVHVTVRMLPHVWNLRSRRSWRVIGRALELAAVRFSTRLCEFSIQGNHIHLVVEAATTEALAQAMQGLGIRIARGLNRMMKKNGRVFADRYHAHVLRTPSEVKHAVQYVRNNLAKHTAARSVDEHSSANPVFVLPAPATWLLRRLRE